VKTIREVRLILQSGTANWSSTLRLCLVLVASAVSGAVLLTMLNALSTITAH
jgi:hypothetical protein